MEEHKIEIGFRYKNEFGDRYESESEFTIYDGVSYSEIDEIGVKLNAFFETGWICQK